MPKLTLYHAQPNKNDRFPCPPYSILPQLLKSLKMFSLKKKKKRLKEREVGRREMERRPGNFGLLRAIHLVSSGPHNLDVTIFSAHIQIYNLPAKEMEMPKLLLGGECWEVLKGPKRREDPSSKNVQDREPVPALRKFLLRPQRTRSGFTLQGPKNTFGQESICTLFPDKQADLQLSRAAFLGWKFTCSGQETGWQSSRGRQEAGHTGGA